jgi:hypothetical protein
MRLSKLDSIKSNLEGDVFFSRWVYHHARGFTMEHQDLSYELLRYENRWVAILQEEERVVGSGADAYEAQQDAERHGYSDVLLMRVRSTDAYYAFNLDDAI